MSLPSHATIQDGRGNILDRVSVNIGWWVDAGRLAHLFMYDIPVKPYPDDATIAAYGIILPVKALRAVASVKELEDHLVPYVERVERGGEYNVTVEYHPSRPTASSQES